MAGQLQAFRDLYDRDPGMWALAQGESSLLIRDAIFKQGNGAFVELHRAIPVPDRDVPLNEILDFRLKRYDELYLLRMEIDTLMQTLAAEGGSEEELDRLIIKVDAACADALRVGKEWRFPVRLSSLKASLDLRSFASIAAAYAGWKVAEGNGLLLSSASALISGTAASFKVGGDFGLQGVRPRQGPYRYVSRFHNELV